MESSILKKAGKHLSDRRKKRRWKEIISVLAVLIMLGTIFMLAQPAFTLEGDPLCGQEEHKHTDECYEEVLICGYDDEAAASSAETAAAAPAGEDQAAEVQPEAPKGAEAAGHQHDDSCYTETKTLTCGQEENPGHQHTDGCYTVNETKELTCGEEESEEHTHTDGCYTVNETKELTCGEEEGAGAHTHEDTCYQISKELTCGQEETAAPETPAPETPSTEAAPPSDGEGHVHTDECYEKKEICGKEEHEHTDECYNQDYTCGKREHTHTDACKDENGNLICGQEEHTHIQRCRMPVFCGIKDHEHEYGCYIGPEVSEEDRERIINVDEMIDALPTYEEIAEKMEALDEAGDEEEYENYYIEISFQAGLVYVQYEALNYENVETQQYVVNSEDLLSLNWLWEAAVMSAADGANYTICHINKALAASKVALVYGNGKTVQEAANDGFSWSIGYVVEKQSDNSFKITKFLTNSKGVSKGNEKIPTDGFILFFHDQAIPSEMEKLVGQYVTVNFDYKAYNGVDNAGGFGTVTIGDESLIAKPKEPKNNNLQTIEAASTAGLIDINLYDYGTNINDLYRNNKNYPGFQQDGGTLGTIDVTGQGWPGAGSYNFGDNIANEISVRERSLTNAGGAINATVNGANSPINGLNASVNPMKNTLTDDGYPQLSNGTSLAYLFSDNTYAKRMNQDGLDGLFLYNDTNISYTFNSRENHAEYNAATNKFDLYNEMISANFIMYPFGNFLPFNKINTEATKASEIDRRYFQTIAATAAYKRTNGAGNEYEILDKKLTEFVSAMDKKYKGTSWDASHAINSYFYAADIPKTDWTLEKLDNIGGTGKSLYSIDYDESKNFFFGMSMEMNMRQPKDGLSGRSGKDPVVFYFTGDDDVWVYLDNMLFLNLSGIHRHVGGIIDFEKGKITYYSLLKPTGDIDENNAEYEDTFEAAIRRALTEQGKSDAEITAALDKILKKDASGNYTTFKDNSSHNFKFYYMERGAGSGVCRMNFNFPLEQKNHLTVGKELSVNNEEAGQLLGSPEFKFQILEANDDGTKPTNKSDEKLFVKAGTVYKIYKKQDACTNTKAGHVHTAVCLQNEKQLSCGQITGDGHTHTAACYTEIVIADTGETGEVDENGIFKLHKGEYAVFPSVSVVSNGYYVRELLEKELFEQYGTIEVSGQSATTNNDIKIGQTSFVGLESGVFYMLDGSTFFSFDNRVNVNKLGAIEITKQVKAGNEEGAADGFDADKKDEFRFKIRLSGELLPVGTPYMVIGDTVQRTVEEEGYIVLKAGETARLENILAGTAFIVKEDNAAKLGYTPDYQEVSSNKYAEIKTGTDGVKYVEGKISVVDAKVILTVINTLMPEKLKIPVKKTLQNAADGKEHTYTFVLEETDSNWQKIENPYTKEISVTVPADGNGDNISEALGEFTLNYWKNAYEIGKAYNFYYRITEKLEEIIGEDAGWITKYDKTAALVTVTVQRTEEGQLIVDKVITIDGDIIGGKSVNEATFTNRLYEWQLVKRSSSSTPEKLITLKDAGFELKENAAEGQQAKVYYGKSGEEGVVTWYEDAGYTKLFNIYQLNGTYTLSETVAPKGYLLSVGTWTITFEQGKEPVIYKDTETKVPVTEINDTNGDKKAIAFYFDNEVFYTLPETGGPGTYWYSIGGTLLLLAGALILYRIRNREVLIK